MSDKDYRARLDEIIKATPDELTLGQQYGRTRALCRELIAENKRLENQVKLLAPFSQAGKGTRA